MYRDNYVKRESEPFSRRREGSKERKHDNSTLLLGQTRGGGGEGKKDKSYEGKMEVKNECELRCEGAEEVEMDGDEERRKGR